MAITDWPATERPRERFLELGAQALTEAELLAVFLRTGTPGVSAVDLARQALDHFGGLNALLTAPLPAFTALNGLGPAKFAQLRAALELARRALRETLGERPLLNSPPVVRDYLRLSLARLPYEVFAVLFLDAQHRLLAYEEMFRGTLTQTSVHAREVVKRALHENAAGVILAHNHPSGHAQPSGADLELTETLARALALVEVQVIDHLLVTGNQAVSFAELGLLPR